MGIMLAGMKSVLKSSHRCSHTAATKN